MEFYKVGYKGRHFTLQDKLYGEDNFLGKIDSEEITDEFLMNHIEDCAYYGVAPYIGRDSEMNRRIDDAYEALYGIRPDEDAFLEKK